MAFTYREGLDRPLTYQEMDDNLEHVEQLADQAEAMSDSAGASAAQATASAGLAEDQVALAADQAQLAEGHEEQAQIYAAAAQSAAGVPSLAGNSGKVLGVASGEQGVEWKQLGTAATRDVTVGNADDTAGRLLKVGDLGSNKHNGAVVDFNELPELYPYSGLVPVMSDVGSVNGPPNSIYHHVFQTLYSTGNVTQIAIPYRVGIEGFFLRSRFSGYWNQWREVLYTGNWYLGTDKQHTANATGAVTLDLATASTFDLTLTGNTTLTVSNAVVPAGETRSIVVRIRQGATARTLTWWSGITWLASTTPAAPAANKIKEYVLSYDGSSWLGREGASN